ncbi:MAG: hypothetical protein C4534_08965 [Gaiellales bacterium]|nr:MAG: hypothetical protein C4534_08965 [Gaiellales bacterium]
MDETGTSGGEDGSRQFDLSQPQQGEPTLEGSGAGDAPQDERPGEEEALPGPEGEPAAAGEPEAGPGSEGEPGPEPGSATKGRTGLPLPLLRELEGEPPARPAAPLPVDEEAAAGQEAGEEGNGRRLSEQWRIDLKWIFGIPATIVLILTLAAFTLFRVSGEEAAGTVVEDTRRQIVEDARFRRELSLVDPALLELIDGEEFTAALYEDPEILRSMIDAIPAVQEGDPRAGEVAYVREALGIFSGLTGVIGKSQHIQARSALIALTLLLTLFGVPYIIFSRRLGRIVSPAVSLALASWLPLLGLFLLRNNLSGWLAGRPGIVEDYQKNLVLGMVDAYAGGLVDAAMPVYRFCSLAALIMIGFGFLGLLIVWWRFNESMIPRRKKLRD